VVGVFPNETSASTLATEIALGSSEEWALRRYSDTGHPHGNRNTKPTTFETLTIGPRPPVGLRPDNGKCRWYTLFFISNFTITRTEEKNLSASRFSPSTVPVNHSIPRRPASSARRLSRSLPIPLDRHRSSTTIAISASRASCRAYMA
jgi:hypothetical protein